MVGTKEWYDLMSNFEKNYSELRLDKEDRENWNKGIIYQNGETNKLFKVFLMGYSLGRIY